MSHDDDIDENRRNFLLKATLAVTAVGVVVATVPFITSLEPNELVEAEGAPIKVNIGQMKPGDQLTVMWRGKPIWIVRRTPQMLDELPKLNHLLRDPLSKVKQQPNYADNIYRSIKPEFLVLVGICTHLGCIPTYRPDPNSVEPGWPGGFFCTCHGSKYDLAGRVYKDVPAPINLQVPSYVYLDGDVLLIGEDKKPTTEKG